jgi:putative CocE/NonD family hydrolase
MCLRVIRRTVGLSVFTLLFCTPLLAQGLEWVKENYTKYEYYITMRDGVRLYTAVYSPKDGSKTYPIMLSRTPYSIAPYGPERYRANLGPSPLFAKEGYIFVYQDVRGRWMSEGSFDHMRPHRDVKRSSKEIDESSDTYDTIEWLLKNVSNHNGRVGQWGISYPGFYAAAGMIDAHPALKASSPQAPVIDWFSRDDWHHNGTLWLAHAFGWFSGSGWPFSQPTTVYPGPQIDRGTADGYEFFMRIGPVRNTNEKFFKGQMSFWNDMLKHETKDDFWQARNLSPHLRNIKPAVMTVGGWYDAENLYGTLECYRQTEKNSPGAFNILVMGPWVHGGWAGTPGDSLGLVRFDAKTAEFYREQIELKFFNYYLKDKGTMDLPEAYVFETGTNQWRKLNAWPPKQTVGKTLYLHGGGKLSFDASAADEANAFDEYVSDPQKPVPFIQDIAPGMTQTYMTDDQRFAARRPDVLVYQSDVLEEDVTIAGPILPSLFVSTTGTDSDWVVKLIDVYPDRYPDVEGRNDNRLGAYQQLVRGDVLRGKFRNGLEKPEALEPGKPTRVEFTMDDAFHTFRRGHRIMIQVQSTWFPLMNLSPQKFVQINEATDADFQKATERVYHSRTMPSQVKVGVVPREALRSGNE